MTADIFERLAAPFPPARVSWRVGSVTKDKTKAMALAYIDARDVMERLDEVCGAGNWERRHPHVDKTTTCEIAIWIEGRGWVVKADGAGDTAVEAEKGSLSDSFKRAAVNWGVGRYLYDLDSPWVEIDEWKKIKPTEVPKLQAVLARYKPNTPPPPAKSEVGSGRKTPAQAKRDGDHEKYMAEFAKLDQAGVIDWLTNFDSYTADAPAQWLDALKDRLEDHKRDLDRPAESADAEQEFDEGFRAAVGPSAANQSRVAGGERQVAAG